MIPSAKKTKQTNKKIPVQILHFHFSLPGQFELRSHYFLLRDKVRPPECYERNPEEAMFPQPLSPRSTNYWAVGILFCFQISNLIVSLNLEMFSHLVTVKMCSLKERCLPTWMLMHKGSCCFLGLQESPFSSLALGKLGGI